MATSYSTLGDLSRGRYQMMGHCGRSCGHGRALNLDLLIARLGADYSYIGDRRIAAALVCQSCGHRGGKITISPP